MKWPPRIRSSQAEDNTTTRKATEYAGAAASELRRSKNRAGIGLDRAATAVPFGLPAAFEYTTGVITAAATVFRLTEQLRTTPLYEYTAVKLGRGHRIQPRSWRLPQAPLLQWKPKYDTVTGAAGERSAVQVFAGRREGTGWV